MGNKKVINIFLASSIEEFRVERLELSDFIRDINDRYEDRYDISVRLRKCENMDNAVQVRRKQEQYNREICESDMVFFLFFTKAGEYTVEEFDVAFERFKAEDRPKIYTYFKVVPEGTAKEQTVVDFMLRLDREIGHYYSMFENIDTVKLRVLLELKIKELGVAELVLENDKILLNGETVMNANNIDFVVNNDELNRVKRELKETCEVYYEAIETKRPAAVVSALVRQKEELEKTLADSERIIIGIFESMYEFNHYGIIDARLKAAYQAFEAGNMNLIREIIDENKIKDEFQFAEKKQELSHKENQCKVKALLLKIEALKVSRDANRFRDIEAIYDIATGEVEKLHIFDTYPEDFEIWYDYASFLNDQNKTQKAYETMRKLEYFYQNPNISVDECNKAKLFSLLGIISYHLNRNRITEEYYQKAIELYEKLAKNNPELFEQDLAVNYNNAGVFYKDQGWPEKAEEYCQKAIEIRERLAQADPERFGPKLAGSYNNAGVFYSYQGQLEKAEEYYQKAIELQERLAQTNPEQFVPNLARSYNNAGIVYINQGRPEKANEYCQKVINIYDKLSITNPERFEPYLVESYNNVGVFYSSQGRPDKAEEYFQNALKLQERLAQANPEHFEPNLAMSYNNVGVFYTNQSRPEKAEKYFQKAIKLEEQLAQANPERFEPDLALSLYNYSIIENTKSFREKALNLAKKHPNNPYCKEIIEDLI